MEVRGPITILGGGMAGLSAAYFAHKKGHAISLYEAKDRLGGLCITMAKGDFAFDSGAHRFHDKDPSATQVVKDLLGDRLRRVRRPSHIFFRRRFVDFPLSPLNLLRSMGLPAFCRAGVEVLVRRLAKAPEIRDFYAFAVHTYGPTVAGSFLLNYSKKLWGRDCHDLSPAIAGSRLKGLTLKTVLKEALFGQHAKTEHLDGAFFYPDQGIGAVADALVAACPRENLHTGYRVRSLFHRQGRIRAISNGNTRVPIPGSVISTLPVNELVLSLQPAAPEEILQAARGLTYRHLKLVGFMLSRDQVSPSATVYFPDKDLPFTRLYEPINRNPLMAPKGKTSLVVEVPCGKQDAWWHKDQDRAVGEIADCLVTLGWIKYADILDGWSCSFENAYPLLERGYETRRNLTMDYLSGFSNLHLSGRCGTFTYTHMHDMLRRARQIVCNLQANHQESA